jgi:hypothetical protein
MQYLQSQEMKFGMFAQLLRPARSVGFFDISCSTQLHCLCQTGADGGEVSGMR